MLHRLVGSRISRYAIAIGMMLVALHPLHAQNLKDRVKAAFVFNFAKFVEWPPTSFADSDSELRFCMLADQEFTKAVALVVENASIDGRRLISHTVRHRDELASCHLLYIDGERFAAAEWLSELRGRPILSVSDAESFIDEGGIIRFVLVDGKLRFEIHQGRALESNLVVSSRLLQLAKTVYRD